MATLQSASAQPIRISAEEAAARMAAGQPMTVLDARSPEAWSESRQRVRGAVRVDRDHLRIEPSWPKDRLTVVYCT
ncbi:MAG TPA: rhodanese-like domain-containing protein [Gemmataceae bacterium]|nr:rhodanese-like domain-containing protein [Gemmataceae bacterium]